MVAHRKTLVLSRCEIVLVGIGLLLVMCTRSVRMPQGSRGAAGQVQIMSRVPYCRIGLFWKGPLGRAAMWFGAAVLGACFLGHCGDACGAWEGTFGTRRGGLRLVRGLGDALLTASSAAFILCSLRLIGASLTDPSCMEFRWTLYSCGWACAWQRRGEITRRHRRADGCRYTGQAIGRGGWGCSKFPAPTAK